MMWLEEEILDLQAPTLAGPSRTNPVAGTPSCTTPWQSTLYIFFLCVIFSSVAEAAIYCDSSDLVPIEILSPNFIGRLINSIFPLNSSSK